MELEGVVHNGVIVPEEGQCPLPEGTKVRILTNGDVQKPDAPESSDETPGQRLNRMADRLKSESHGLPADYSVNFEHYLYSAPKRA